MTMTARQRRYLLLVGLAVAALAWTSFSVLSPGQGWFGKVLVLARTAYQRATAEAPCPGELTRVATVSGIRFRHPECYESLMEPKSELGDAMVLTDARGMSGFVVSVGRLTDQASDAYRSSLLKRKQPDCDRIECGDWEAIFCATRRATLLGSYRVVSFDLVLPEHLVDSELGEYASAVFLEMVSSICEENPAHQDPSHASP